MDSPSLTKYRDVCAETVTRLYTEDLEKRKNAKEAEKALKTALHQITGAFMTEGELKRARKLLNEGAPIRELLALHASTRERLAHIDAFYTALLPSASPRLTILDLACGLNPLYLGSLGHSVYGVDISGGCVDLINSAARKMNWDVSAVCRDLMCDPPLPEADAALAMKLLPVLEQQKKGAALNLL